MTTSDVTYTQDGAGNVKIHPYVVALVRWCVSCVWSAATVVLHRLMTPSLRTIQAGKFPPSSTHIHPEPRVECRVLRAPSTEPTVDFVFVHGLYGSLENTWRQGDWRSKYKIQPNKIPLRRQHSFTTDCKCNKCRRKSVFNSPLKDFTHCICNNSKNNQVRKDDLISKKITKSDDNKEDTQCTCDNLTKNDIEKDNIFVNEKISIQNVNDENIGDMFITESFYSKDLAEKIDIVDNYDVQAQFVRDLFKLDNENCYGKVQNDKYKVSKSDEYYFDKESIHFNSLHENDSKYCNYMDDIKKDLYELNNQTKFNNIKFTKTDKNLSNDIKYDVNKPKPKNINEIDTKVSNTDECDIKSSKNIEIDIKTSLCNKSHIQSSHVNENLIKSSDDNESHVKSSDGNESHIKTSDGNETHIKSSDINESDIKSSDDNEIDIKSSDDNEIDIKSSDDNEIDIKSNEKTCDVGCGCICDRCYSKCWPKDWLQEDYPDARVISINYTSDPYLWRPLWVKACKRLRLHERAEQMARQLIALGVGKRPIVWVGHSKGGLFIKQIYCEAYEAYQKLEKLTKMSNENENVPLINPDNNVTEDINNTINKSSHHNELNLDSNILDNNGNNESEMNQEYNQMYNAFLENNNVIEKNIDVYEGNNTNNDKSVYNHEQSVEKYNENGDINEKASEEILDTNPSNSDDCADNLFIFEEDTKIEESSTININAKSTNNNEQQSHQSITKYTLTKEENINVQELRKQAKTTNNNEQQSHQSITKYTLTKEDDINIEELKKQASLWSNSAGFMFYSVPHRGSPLADIKTPITARSIELLEISKDCSQVVSLQSRWLAATQAATPPETSDAPHAPQNVRRRPIVRSLVETNRTLMSVLWLRIVSEDEADAGIGSLSGVSLDHREICKPSSRHCVLYTELTKLVDAALGRTHQC